MELKEVRTLLKRYTKDDIDFGKTEEYLLQRISATKDEVIRDLLSLENLEFIEEQERRGEKRYVLFFVYSGKNGRVYVITLRDKLRLITAYPLGRRTLSKYHKRRFINS